jgi:thiamine-phosphate pyrophosphorylase
MKLHGLYVITDDCRSGPEAVSAKVACAIRGGARIVQYRDKGADASRRRAEAEAIRHFTRAAGIPLLINDDVALATAIGADGVHLGRDDGDVASARAALPAGCLVGVSCYNDFERARQARLAGADYVAFGAFFPSVTKPEAVRAERPLLTRTRTELHLPTVAIGGISPENGASLVAAGADMLAVVSAVFAADDITRAARAFARCFDPPEETDR